MHSLGFWAWLTRLSFWLLPTRRRGVDRGDNQRCRTHSGDRHSYLCHHDDLRPDKRPTDHLHATKIFHVSPFQPVDADTASL